MDLKTYWIEASEIAFDRLKEIGLQSLIKRDKNIYAYYISDGWFCGASKGFVALECTLLSQGKITETGEIETLPTPEPFTVTEVEDLDIDHKVVAKYIGKDPESMRQLKRKWESTETGMWIHYVRSYKYTLGGV